MFACNSELITYFILKMFIVVTVFFLNLNLLFSMLFIVILVESPASHWGSLNSQKMICHTGGPHFFKGVPIFPEIWGSQVPILPGKWGPGSPYSQEYRDTGPHFPRSMGTRDPHFGGSPFSHDTGTATLHTNIYYTTSLVSTISEAEHPSGAC